jgi:hypothetical protein
MSPSLKTCACGAIVLACTLAFVLGVPPKLESFAFGLLLGTGASLLLLPETLLERQPMKGFRGVLRNH